MVPPPPPQPGSHPGWPALCPGPSPLPPAPPLENKRRVSSVVRPALAPPSPRALGLSGLSGLCGLSPHCRCQRARASGPGLGCSEGESHSPGGENTRQTPGGAAPLSPHPPAAETPPRAGLWPGFLSGGRREGLGRRSHGCPRVHLAPPAAGLLASLAGAETEPWDRRRRPGSGLSFPMEQCGTRLSISTSSTSPGWGGPGPHPARQDSPAGR